MDKDLGKIRVLSSRKESLLSRSYPPSETNFVNKPTPNEILCVEVSDDSDHEAERHESQPLISIQLRQNTETNPVDKELLKCFNNDFMNAGKRTLSHSSSDNTVFKRTKLFGPELPLKVPDHLQTTSSESDQDEVIELESLSSHNRNTRLKSSESSSEIRVSSSSKSTPPRPRLTKNTVPGDSFERYLTGISKKYRELTHRDRVLLWEFSSDLSDVEDYIQFEEKYEKYKTTKRYLNNSKNLVENNNGEASCSTRNNWNTKSISSSKVAPKEAPPIKNPETLDRKNSPKDVEMEEASKEEDVVMSINTETKEMYKHEPILLDSDESKNTSSPLDLIWSDEDSVFKRSRLNPEIDKISRIIHSSMLNNGNDIKSHNCEPRSYVNQENFKIPNVPRKYLPCKVDTCQKEEFYKYLGLGTISPNGKCEDEHEHTDNKRRSLRVRRLQLQHSPTTGQDEKKDNHASEEVSSQKSNKSSLSQSPTRDMEGSGKILDKQASPTLIISKARRTCGPVVKSSSSPSMQEMKDGSVSPKLSQKDCPNLTPSRKSESTGDAESESSANTMVLMRHSYEKLCTSSPYEDAGQNQPFCRDLTGTNEQIFSMRLRNGIKPPENVAVKPKYAKISENKVQNTASIMYNKFKEFRLSLKDVTGSKTSSILLKCEYNDGSSQPQKTEKTENKEPIKPNDSTPLEFVLNWNTSTTCPVVSEKKESKINVEIEQRKSAPTKSFHRTVIKKSKKLWGRSQRVNILRSSVLNQRILRNRKFVIITTKTLNKNSRPRIVRKHKRSPSEKSANLLSPARVAKMDKADENVIVKAPELEVKVAERFEDIEKTEATEEKIITKVEYAVPNFLPNPLDSEKGEVLHAFYVQDLLIVVQKFFISCWKYSKVVQFLGKSQEWEQLGECKRKLNDFEVSAPFKNRLCLNETNPVYLEMRAKQIPDDADRVANLASVYINVYYFDDWKAAILTYSVQLDTIRGLATDVTYTTITNSRYFIMCWKQESVLGANRTGLCKYALTPDLDTLASIREFKHMRHIIHHLECINDDKLIGFGETQVTIWDHRTGDVLTNFDLEISLGRNVGSIISSIQFKSYLFLYQTRFTENCETPELKILAITLSASTPSFRLIYTHELPPSFTDIKSSICTENYVITTSAMGEEFLLLPHQPDRLYYFNPSLATTLKRFHTSGSQNFVEISNETLVIKPYGEYLMNFMR